jgi:hypothetical protein
MKKGALAMCCGNQRAAARAAVMPPAAAPTLSARAAAAAQTSVISFEYVGRGEAAIRGPVSGRLYRFSRPGERREVDARDRPGLAALPVLRWVR